MPVFYLLMISSFLSMILVLVIAFKRPEARIPCTFIWGILFTTLFIGAPLVLHLLYDYALSIRGGYIKDESIYIIYSVITIVFVIFYYIYVACRIARSENQKIYQPKFIYNKSIPPDFKRFHLICACFIFVGVALFIQGTGLSFGQLLVASRFEWFLLGTKSSLVLNLGFYLIGMSAVYAYYDVRYSVPRKFLSLAAYGTILLMTYLAGGRKWLLFVASGLAAGYYDKIRGKIVVNKKVVLVTMMIVFPVFSWQFGRTIAWEEGKPLEEITESFTEKIPDLFAAGDATYFYRASLEAISLNKDYGVWYPFALIRRILFMPIPNEYTFGLKPKGIPFLFADDMGLSNRARYGNQPPGLFGLFVLSFGWVSAIFALPLLIIPSLHWFDKYINNNHHIIRNTIFSSFIISSILFMRGSTGGIYFMVANLLLTICFGSFLNNILKSSK